jgi:hypothetical protein
MVTSDLYFSTRPRYSQDTYISLPIYLRLKFIGAREILNEDFDSYMRQSESPNEDEYADLTMILLYRDFRSLPFKACA